MLSFVLAVLVGGVTAELDTSQCAACALAMQNLGKVLNSTKKELERSKEFNDKKAQKVDKVQKAQTKRWLKNEYGVALRAALEEEMELLCGRDVMMTTLDLQQACAAFIEAHEDSLPRAALDEMPADTFCASSVPGCTGDAMHDAVGTNRRTLRSEPKKGLKRPVRGAVARLVGKMYTDWIREAMESAHVFVLVHNSSDGADEACTPNRCDYEVRSSAYAALVSEFYAFAVAANSSGGESAERLRFAQIDTSKNDVPQNTPLAEPSGVALLMYLKGSRSAEVKSLPAVGESSLAGADASSVRSHLAGWLLTYMPKRDQPMVQQLMKEREKVASKASARDDEGDGDGAAPPTPKPTPAQPAAPRRKRPRKQREDGERESAQLCDMCALVVGQLQLTLRMTKEELETSRAQKAAHADGVQKAQTKRWLKNEYSVELAASLEERLEGICENATLYEPLCKRPAGTRAELWADGGTKGCAKLGEARCRSVTEDHAEALMRATLDGKGGAECSKVLADCVPATDLLQAIDALKDQGGAAVKDEM